MRTPPRGFTLIELIISIVVIGIAVTAVLGVMARTMATSADPMFQQQGIAVAEAYLEEILTKSYSPLPGTTNRSEFDDIGDYNGLTDTGAHDQFGNPVNGLEGYNVTVTVQPEAALSGVNARRIDVTVTPPAGTAVVLSSYRTPF